jgi:hypothetical protein
MVTYCSITHQTSLWNSICIAHFIKISNQIIHKYNKIILNTFEIAFH